MTSLLKYRRVAQRIREKFGNTNFEYKDLEDAIFIECGCDPRTVKAALERMTRLKLINEIKQEREFGIQKTREFELSQTHNEYF